jgi:MFS family permease
VVILLNGLSYAAVIYALSRMRESELTPVPRAPRQPGMLREGVAYVRGRRDIMLILAVVFFAGTFGMNFQITSALMATEVFGKGAGEFGILGSAMAVGSLAGALMAARRVRIRIRLLVVAALGFGAAEIVAGLMPTFVAFALMCPVIGFCTLTMLNSANATMQLESAPALRGRVMALYMTIVMGGTPIGSPIIGWVGQTFGPRWTLLGGGLLVIVGVVVAVALFARPARLAAETAAAAEPERVAAQAA